MNDEFDFSEIEERLYSQIYHSTGENIENQQMDHNVNIQMNRNRRYFNSGINSSIKNISVRIDVHNEPTQATSQGYNFREKSYPPRNKRMTKSMNKQLNMQNISDFDNINLREIKAKVDAFPQFVKCLPPHIRKRLKKMNKRIAFIQKKKYLETITKINSNQTRLVALRKRKLTVQSDKGPVKSIKTESSSEGKTIVSKQENNSFISISDEDIKHTKIIKVKSGFKPDFIEISSSDDEADTTKLIVQKSALNTITVSTVEDVFKRPDDDDVIFVEPIAADIINVDIDAESNCSTSTKSSIDRTSNNKRTPVDKHKLHLERKELLSTPESNNSNDFLESAVTTENTSWRFNFGLHGTDFGPSKESSKHNVKDVSGSESSCSVTACDLGGLLASSKCALFNEVDFESPSKNIFEESNMESFGDYIIPNRVDKKIARNISHASPLMDEVSGNSTRKKLHKEKLPNLSSIDPKETHDLDTAALTEIEVRTKKKKKSKQMVEVNTNDDDDDQAIEIRSELSKKKKSKILEPNIIENAEEESDISSASALPKLKKKRKKLQSSSVEELPIEPGDSGEDQSLLSDGHEKKKKKNKKSCVDDNDHSELNSGGGKGDTIRMNTEVYNVVIDELPKKKKTKKPLKPKNIMQDNSNTDLAPSFGTADETSCNTNVSNILTDHQPTKLSNKEICNIAGVNSEIDSSVGMSLKGHEPKKKKNKRSLNQSNHNSDADSSVQIIDSFTNTDDSSIPIETEPKKKKHKLKKIGDEVPITIECEETSEDLIKSISDYSLEVMQAAKKKKLKNKSLSPHINKTHHTETTSVFEAETGKRKRKRNKSATSDVSVVVDSSEYIVPSSTNRSPEINKDQIQQIDTDREESKLVENNAITVDIRTDLSTSSISDKNVGMELETSAVVVLDDSLDICPSADSISHISLSDDTASSVDSDSDLSNINDEGADIQVVNVMFKEEPGYHDLDERDLNNIWNNMSDDVSKWKILPVDRHPPRSPKVKTRCRRCREVGHFASQCKKKPVSICCLCSGRGHLEPRCPNKLCTNCGRRSKFFTTFCSRCAHTKHRLCRICKMKGHDQNICPDLWRRYHLTISTGRIVHPAEDNNSPTVEWCSGCGKRGHLEYQCQYFARDHCPTVPDVVSYVDNLYKGKFVAASPVTLETPLVQTTSANLVTVQSSNSDHAPTFESSADSPIVAIIEKSMEQQSTSNLQQDVLRISSTDPSSRIDAKPPTFKTFIPIPQPIGSDSTKNEAGIDMSERELANISFSVPPPPLMSLPIAPPFLYLPVSLPGTQLSWNPISTQFQVSHLHAKYLRLHDAGIFEINKLAFVEPGDIQIYPNGQINILTSTYSCGTTFKNAILSHLDEVPQLIIPTDVIKLIVFLEEILIDLSVESTVENMKKCLANLQDDSLINKFVVVQHLNMMIYGYFKWEYGERNADRLKDILITLKENGNINDDLLNTLKKCLKYLIECERPICMYQDMIDSISEAKRNFFDVASLRIPDELPLQTTVHIEIDPIKYDYVKSSFTVQFMLYRWKAKLDVALSNEKDDLLALILNGNIEDINNACEEYEMVVGKGPTLPTRKWAVYNIISHVLDQIHKEEPSCDNFNAKMMRNIGNNIHCNRSKLKRTHMHLIVTRGLKGGREKMVILQDFIKTYQPSMQDDFLSQDDQKQIQEAFNIIQFNETSDISYYGAIYSSSCKSTIDKIVLSIDDYNILNATKEYCPPWLDKIDLSCPEIINLKHVSILIAGTDEESCNLKKHVFDYLDQAYILDSNPKSLSHKLKDSLKKLWIKPYKNDRSQMILNRIHILESKKINSYHIEILAKLYQQLHMYFFGCCRLHAYTGNEVPTNNHVDTLRAYIGYLGTVESVPPDVQQNIFETYNYIFGREKMNHVDYKMLHKNAWQFYIKYKRIDQNTIFICEPAVKKYLTNSPPLSNFKSLTINENPLIEHDDLRKYINDSFMIIINNNASTNLKLSILIRSDSFKLFSASYYEISANLLMSLQAIDEIGSKLDSSTALDLLQHIHLLEENSPNSELIGEKYQVLNIYLFGCCHLIKGKDHLNILKNWSIQFALPEKASNYILDPTTLNTLISSYEYVFWKGRKPGINYNFLVNKTSITNTKSVTTIPIRSNYIYNYFMHVTEGIAFIALLKCRVRVEIMDDQRNRTVIKLIGNSNARASLTENLLKEIDRISVFKDIPLQVVPLRNYLNCKLQAVMNSESHLIPITILHDIDAITQQMNPSMHYTYTEYVKLCLMKESLCFQLNVYMLGVNETDEARKHLLTLKTFAMRLNVKPENMPTMKEMGCLLHSLNYLFSQKLDMNVYVKFLEDRANYAKVVKSVTRLDLLPLVYHYLKSSDHLSNPPLTKLQFQFDYRSPFILVSGSNSYINWVRNVLWQFNKILSKIPKYQNQLIIFLDDFFNSIQELDDPKSVWTNICLLEQHDSNNSSELNELYIKLHRHLFGFHRLGNGKGLMQVLDQHLINLRNICITADIISMEILQEIYFALEYIEGSSKQLSSQEYEDFINGLCVNDKNTSNNSLIEGIVKNEGSEYQHSISSAAVHKHKCSSIELIVQQNTPLIPNYDLGPTKNVCDCFCNLLDPNTSVEKTCIQPIGSSVLHVNRDKDFINLKEKVDDSFVAYIKRIEAGQLFLRKLKEFVKVEPRGKQMVLSGNKDHVKTASNMIREHCKMECNKLRIQIMIEMNNLRSQGNVDVSVLYQKLLYSELSQKYGRSMKMLHAHLFGRYKFLDGPYHFDALSKFLHSDEVPGNDRIIEIRKSFEYIFGCIKKPIDYEAIIRTLG